ncbi:hypothetical protein PCANC_12939 [Puccinia coronata f. sp. avenae]|uniref:Uncharacterized protein n=1 Tax=Puccinia coronata f. sp. avenae TaxID=200324 RepID=A0A2N5UNA3_9BASI|nr:hypothetical protein PCANC_12939 [Puccinia coronata f. sp. avenae]
MAEIRKHSCDSCTRMRPSEFSFLPVRVLPPCLIPNVKKGNTTASSVTLPGPSSDDAASSDDPVVVNINQSQQATPGAVGKSAQPKGLTAVGDNTTGSDNDSSGDHSLIHNGREDKSPTPESCIMLTPAEESQPILNRSPVCKVHRSPTCVDQPFISWKETLFIPPQSSPSLIASCGYAPVLLCSSQFSRLNFASRRGGRGVPSGSPTRKALSSLGASSRHSPSASAGPTSPSGLASAPRHSPSASAGLTSPSVLASACPVSPSPAAVSAMTPASRPRAPPSARALAMTLDQFLTHARFDIDDQVVQVLISMNQIQHWCYFRHSSVSDLCRRGFPHPIVVQIMDGAELLELSLAEENISYLYEV